MVDDQDDRLVEHTAKTLVSNQNTAGFNVRDLQSVPIKRKNKSKVILVR